MQLTAARQAAERVSVSVNGRSQVWHVWHRAHPQRPLVLMHGGSGSWTHWVHNVLALSQFRSVWALDIPGFGDSDLPEGAQDVDDLIDPVVQGMQELFGATPVDVAGFSFGGMLAGLVAAREPRRFAQVLMLGTPGLGLFDGPPPHIRGFTPDMNSEQRDAVHRHNLLSFMLKHERSVTAETLRIQAENVARDRLKRRRLARTDIVLKAQAGWRQPVHFAFGDADRLYPDRLRDIPGLFEPGRLSSFTLIPDAGHWVMYEQPQATTDWILSKLG